MRREVERRSVSHNFCARKSERNMERKSERDTNRKSERGTKRKGEFGQGERVKKDRNGAESICRGRRYNLVFCHLEYLRVSNSPDLYLTQLAGTNNATDCLFLPILPPILGDYLDQYKLGGDLLSSLTLSREDGKTFLFRPPVLVAQTERLECIQEGKALSAFFDFLETTGPNVVLVMLDCKERFVQWMFHQVCLDEATVGVLIDKLWAKDKRRFSKLVDSYTWWGRVLQHTGCKDYKYVFLFRCVSVLLRSVHN